MRVRHFVMMLGLLTSATAFAQQGDYPQDYFTNAFHAGRRDSLRQIMPANSVFVVWAFPTRNFSNDVDYVFHQNPDLYYFTGYKEPQSLCIIFKEPQTAADGSTYKELMFVQKRNPQAEQWTGKRLGVEGTKKLGLTHVYNGEDFKNTAIDFSQFDKIIFDQLPTDLADARYDSADLYDLIKQLKEKAKVPDNYQQDKRFATALYRQLTGQLREIKTEEELTMLRKAVEISCQGQAEVMRAIRPDMSEREIQGIQELVHKKYGAENVGYPSIVGAGNNGCVLHYEENERLNTGNGKMVLMDVGAEYHGYTADVTRTVPANGKFSPEQKAIYEIVYNAQEAAFKLCKEGTTWQELDKVSRDIIVEGLMKLGIITKKEEARKYYPHGLGHHIGMDVHDRGSYDKIKKGMVITIEPGIYIPEGSNCDKKWWGVAVRIEDDLHIREKDYELLSSAAPRKISDIEKMAAEKSVFDNFVLPKLKSDKKGF